MCRNEATLMTFIFPCGFLVAARVGISWQRFRTRKRVDVASREGAVECADPMR